MKSRSEIMAERKAAEKKFKSRETVSELHCDDCEKDYPLADLNKREDGDYECPGCAMPLKAGKRAHQLASVGGTIRTESLDKVAEVVARTDPRLKDDGARSGSFCGKCGAEWPILDGKFVINCGHLRALRVDDPRKATEMATTTASGAPNPPNGAPRMPAIPPNVTTVIDGNAIRMAWGKAIFPVGEILGISKFSNMEIGPFSLTEVYDSARHVEIVERMLANLQQMADKAFDVQLPWFKEKLGLIK